MTPVSTAPTSERGVMSNDVSMVSSWSSLIDEAEYAPDFQWPASVWVTDKMRSDSQIQGLLSGTILPITRFRYALLDNGCDPAITDRLSAEIKVPVKGREDQFVRGRTRGQFSWHKHLPDALRAVYYGHYFFEQVGFIGDDGLWHLKKLAPRPPKTISEINVAKDGGLVGIKQFATDFAANNAGISVDQLIAYVWDKEGANWTGRSMLRSCFRNWLVKDRLIRVDAGKHERNGMGVPWFEAPEGASQQLIDELDELAQAYRAGDESGGAGPHGAKLRLIGTEGTLPDTIGSIRYHDEQMANNFLMMFMSLGSTLTGSRSLGETFVDFFGYAQEGIADWVVGNFNEYMIEDWIDWNYGEDNPAPLLSYERVSDEELPTDKLAQLVEKGIVKVDKELESAIRKRYKLPDAVEEEEPEQVEPETDPADDPPQPSVQAADGRRNIEAAGSDIPSTVSLPDRTLRRQPYDHEVLAKTDYAAIEVSYTTHRDEAFAAFEEKRLAQIDELVAKIEEIDGDIAKLDALMAERAHEADLAKAMNGALADGVEQATAEAVAQGKTGVKAPALADLEASMAARASSLDGVITRELSTAASQKAITLSGGSLDKKTVAATVKEYLLGFKSTRVKEQIGGAVNQALNAGRRAFMKEAVPTQVYASELLDDNTCGPCTEIDGTEYETVAAAEMDYPGGGYMECDGGDRCRGTLVAVYNEVDPGIGEAE